MGRTTNAKRKKKAAGQGFRGREERGATGGRRKPCPFIEAKVDHIDYKAHEVLREFMSEKGKIRGRRNTGVSRRHQNQLSTAIKRARQVALLPYVGK